MPLQNPASRQMVQQGVAIDAGLRLYIEKLHAAVESLLLTHPEGLSELQLIKTLQRPPWSLLGTVNFNEPSELYPVHFIVFHVVYRLRDELAVRGQNLQISPLLLRVRSAEAASAGYSLPEREDALRSFYLDLANYQLPQSDLDQMLDNFWRGLQRPSTGAVDDALELLELDHLPPDYSAAKRQFRRLAMRHHPDRGGDNVRLQGLNQAIGVLRQHYDAC